MQGGQAHRTHQLGCALILGANSTLTAVDCFDTASTSARIAPASPEFAGPPGASAIPSPRTLTAFCKANAQRPFVTALTPAPEGRKLHMFTWKTLQARTKFQVSTRDPQQHLGIGYAISLRQCVATIGQKPNVVQAQTWKMSFASATTSSL